MPQRDFPHDEHLKYHDDLLQTLSEHITKTEQGLPRATAMAAGLAPKLAALTLELNTVKGELRALKANFDREVDEKHAVLRKAEDALTRRQLSLERELRRVHTAHTAATAERDLLSKRLAHLQERRHAMAASRDALQQQPDARHTIGMAPPEHLPPWDFLLKPLEHLISLPQRLFNNGASDNTPRAGPR